MEYRLQPLDFMKFLQNNNRQAVKKMMIVVLQKNKWNPGVAVYIPRIKYIYI